MVAKLATPSCLGLAISVVLVALVLRLSETPPKKPRLWSPKELALYNGTDDGLPILLGILGSVFDVTIGRAHYGPGGGYNHFSGRFVGTLVGTYYNSEGNPTKLLKAVEAKAARGAHSLEKQKKEEAKLPGCNSRWSQQDGGEVRFLIPLSFLMVRICCGEETKGMIKSNTVAIDHRIFRRRFLFCSKLIGIGIALPKF